MRDKIIVGLIVVGIVVSAYLALVVLAQGTEVQPVPEVSGVWTTRTSLDGEYVYRGKIFENIGEAVKEIMGVE